MKVLKQKWQLILLIGIVAAVIAALFFLLKPEPEATERFADLLSRQQIDKPNILFITMDTTRADRIPVYGYRRIKTPFLDSIAENGIMFKQCITPSALTLPSHSSMMTGLYPTYHGVRVNGNNALSGVHHTLAELFAQQGYKCGAFVAAFVLDGRWGLKQGFHHYDDQFDLKKYKKLDLGHVQRPANEVVDAALNWLDTKKEDHFFTWIHLYDPHTPYEPPEPYRSLYQNGELSGLYDGEIAFTDSQIGRCLQWLEQNNLDKNTIVIVMGDHGEALGEHGELTHGYFLYEYAVHVPFLLRTPFRHLKNMRVRPQVRTIDIYPTLLEMAGIPVPQENQGRSLLPLILGDENNGNNKENYAYSESMTPSIQYGWSPLYSIRDSRYKYVDAPRPEFYDLVNDPKELNNLVRQYPGRVKRYKSALTRIMDETGTGAPEPETANLDQETLRRLATLGYVGTSIKRKSKKGMPLADPKDKLEVFKDISLAAEYLAREKQDEAVQLLEKVLQKDPHIPQAKILLATAYLETGKPAKAKVPLDEILKEDPDNLQALISMANILFDEGKEEDVITLCKKAIIVDDRNTQAYTLMGEVYMGREDHEQALPHIRKAVEIQPKLTRTRLNLAACYIGTKQYAEAETILTKVLKETPKFPLAHFHLGLLNEEQGKLEEAHRFYSKEVELYEQCVPARFNLGRLQFRSGDREGYIKQMEEVVRLAPKKAEGYLFLARGLLYEFQDPDRILELVEKGITVAKTSRLKALGYFLMADIYNRRKQPQKVKDALDKANYYKEKQ
jgi:arylsulfatase A-like enzyme/tetratricopeptide (TPR) repeat protein